MPVATIVEIMESYPLGLRLRTSCEPEDVLINLEEDCKITCAGRFMKPGGLRCGMRVHIADLSAKVIKSLDVLPEI